MGRRRFNSAAFKIVQHLVKAVNLLFSEFQRLFFPAERIAEMTVNACHVKAGKLKKRQKLFLILGLNSQPFHAGIYGGVHFKPEAGIIKGQSVGIIYCRLSQLIAF